MQCLQYFLQYFHNNPKQQVIIGKQKNNYNGKFKIEPVKTYHLSFVVKMLQKCCGYIQHFLKIAQTNKLA